MQPIDDVDVLLKVASELGFSNDAETQARLPAALQGLHRAVLRAFLAGGPPPTTRWLREEASKMALDPGEAIARLAEADLVHVGGDSLTVAYPFSGTPTAHRVHPSNGEPVWAMCAIDALGVLMMTGDDGTVVSSDPDTGAPIRVTRHNGRWQWEPERTVVLVAFTGACQTSAEGLCAHMDFHTDAECAAAHLNANAGLVGQALDQSTGVQLADRIFGPLLSE